MDNMKTQTDSHPFTSFILLMLCAICAGFALDTTLIATTDLTLGWRTICCALAGFALALVWPRINWTK